MVKLVEEDAPPDTNKHSSTHDKWEDFIKNPLQEMSVLMETLKKIRETATEEDLKPIRERMIQIGAAFTNYVHEPHPEESFDLVRELHANVNHQIGNLLSAGQAVTRMYKKQTLMPSIFDTISRVSQRIQYLLLTDFDFARDNFFEARHYQQTPEVWCLAIAQKLAAYKTGGLFCDLSGLKSPEGMSYLIHAHPGIIALALQELIINAEKASDTTQQITISLDREGDTMVFRVVDKGRGMTDAEQKSMFKKGVSNTKSTGMGLWQVQYLAKAFDVRIYCEKSVPGEGTVMAVSVPLITI